jgi:hypothetical protein
LPKRKPENAKGFTGGFERRDDPPDKQYDDVEVIVKTASNDGLSVLWATDKEIAKEFVEETLKDAWETADDWFVC